MTAHAFHRDDATYATILGSDLPREYLTAGRTYYVRADGSNSNTGLGNSSASAWNTLQFAANYITQNIDLGNQTITVLCTGTLTSGIVQAFPFVGRGSVAFDGTSASNCTISSAIPVVISDGAVLTIKNFTLQGLIGAQAFRSAVLTVDGGVVSQGTIYDWFAANAALVRVIGNYTCSGAKLLGSVVANTFGGVELVGAITVTLSNASWPSTGSGGFAFLVIDSYGVMTNVSFTGAATGGRFVLLHNSVLQTNGSNSTSYLPGNAVGFVNTGGIYQ